MVRYRPSPPSVMSCERAAVMSTPGAAMSGFMPPENVSGPVLEKHGELVLLVDRGHGQRRRGRARVTRCSPGPALPAAMTNRVPYCAESASTACDIGSLPSVGSDVAEAHADDVGAGLGGPLHAGDDPGVLAGALGAAEHLADDQVGAGGDALVVAAGGGAGADDRGGDVGAVPVDVGDGLARHEAGRAVDLGSQVGVVDVDAGVEHRDLHALAVVAGRPGLRRADQRHALLEVGLHPAVEPQLGDPAAQGGAWRPRRRPSARRSSRTCGRAASSAFSAAPWMPGSSRTIVLPRGAGGAPAARAVGAGVRRDQRHACRCRRRRSPSRSGR